MRAGVGFETRTHPCSGSGAMKGRGLGGGWVELALGGVEWISPSSSSSILEGDSSSAVVVSPKLVADSPAFDAGSVWLVGNSFNAAVELVKLIAGSLGAEGNSGWLVGNWVKMVASSFRPSVASLVLVINFLVSEIGICGLVVDIVASLVA